MSVLKILPPLLLLAVLADGQILIPGHCPKTQAMENFNISRYLCVWYGYKKYEDREVLNCTRHTYYRKTRKTAKKPIFKYRFITEGITEDNKTVKFRGKIHSDGCGMWSLCTANLFFQRRYPSPPSNSSPYHNVLYTDYTRFSIVGHCKNVSHEFMNMTYPWREQYLVIMVRSLTMTNVLRGDIRKEMKKLGMPMDGLKQIRDRSCPRLAKRKNEGNRCPT